MKDYTYLLSQKINKYYGGANGNKKAVRLEDGALWMMKFPSGAKTKNFEMHYTNDAVSEYICCHIFNIIGVEAQDTQLGTVFDNNKSKVVVLCRDIEDKYNARLFEFAEMKNEQTYSSSNGYGTYIWDVVDAIRSQTAIPPEQFERFYWKMFIVDTLIGNFDRHNGNWGILVSQNGDARIAPVFDCGSGLYSRISDRQIEEVLGDESEISKRIFNFPPSALRGENKTKYSYKEVLAMDIPLLKEEILEMKPIIDKKMKDIYTFIHGMENISEIRKKFYCRMLHERKVRLIDARYKEIHKELANSEPHEKAKKQQKKAL